jgi:hypothetical protein
MGNNNSNPINVENETCLICWENIGSKKWCKCIICNIILDNVCEEKYRGRKDYCKCPHCQRVGSIGTYV